VSFATPRESNSASRRGIYPDDHNVTNRANHQLPETTATSVSYQAVIDDPKARINSTLKNQLAVSDERFQDHLTIWDKTTKQKTDDRALLDCRRRLNKVLEENARLKAILKFRSAGDPGVVPTGPEKPHIREELGHITTRLKMTFDFHQTLTFKIPDRITPNSETEYLLRKVVSGEEASNSDVLLSLTALRDVKPLNLVRAMMSAALRYWVFESDWPRFDNCSCIKPNGYRKLNFLIEGTFKSPWPTSDWYGC
jgi:hypothetical protein